MCQASSYNEAAQQTQTLLILWKYLFIIHTCSLGAAMTLKLW